MKDFINFRKKISYISMSVFALVTIFFFSSYTAMQKERRTKGRLFLNSLLLASEKEKTTKYPFDLRYFKNNRFDVKNIHKDGWGNPLFYERINDGKDYILFSKGKDGIPFTKDDIHTKK